MSAHADLIDAAQDGLLPTGSVISLNAFTTTRDLNRTVMLNVNHPDTLALCAVAWERWQERSNHVTRDRQ